MAVVRRAEARRIWRGPACEACRRGRVRVTARPNFLGGAHSSAIAAVCVDFSSGSLARPEGELFRVTRRPSVRSWWHELTILAATEASAGQSSSRAVAPVTSHRQSYLVRTK